MSQSHEDTTAAGTVDLTEEDRHRLLASERRRVALDILTGLEAPVDLDDLAAIVAERDADGDVPDEELEVSVTIALHHAHLPKIDDFGVIEYNPEAARVETCPSSPIR